MPARLRNLVLVASHFAPSNLVNVHRARLWAQHLPEFGWNPIILTAHPDYYEEPLDWELNALVEAGLEVIRTRALPTRPIRIVGDVGIRALVPQYRALVKLVEQRRIDFLHITIPSNYSAVLGRMLRTSHDVPYGIDYNDPWICEYPGTEQVGSKKWITVRISEALEPWAVRDASLITGVASSYFEDVLDRNPHLRMQAVTAEMPFGTSEADYAYVERTRKSPYLFDPQDGLVHMMYAGAILPKSHALLDSLLQAIALLRRRGNGLATRLRLHFVGTGLRHDDPSSQTVRPYIERHGLSGIVTERPMRIPYLDVLRHLQLASVNLILGSPEPHYTPSKVFQVLQAGKPVIALLHRESSAAHLIARCRAGQLVTFTEAALPTPNIVAEALARVLQDLPSWRPTEIPGADGHSARDSARSLVHAVEGALEQNAKRVA